MTRFTLSAPQRPRYESARYRPSPARRQHIYGRVVGIPDHRSPRLLALIFAALRGSL